MICTTFDLREKDVINVCNGQKLGCISELEIDTDCGRVCAVIIAGDSIASLIFSKNRLRIPWEKIHRIGKDTVLVDLPDLSECRCDSGDSNCKTSGNKEHRWWKCR